MPNSNSPFGLKPVRHMLGLPLNGAVVPMYVPASYATALFIGDPVLKTANGSNAGAVTAPGVGTFDIGTLPEINKSAATGRITGVIVAFAADPTNLGLVYRPASTERIAFVNVDPFTVYEIQSDGALGATSVGLNTDLVFTQSGSTVTGLSGVELNSALVAVTATLQVNILRAVNRVDNDTTATRGKFEVRLATPTEVALGTGAGL